MKREHSRQFSQVELVTKAVLQDETISQLMEAPQITNIENRLLSTELKLPSGFKAVKVTYLFDPKVPYSLVDIIKRNKKI